MQATKASERSQQDSSQNTQRQANDLDNRYGKIGISAVAAALRPKGERQTQTEYRIPYDRD
jgi:hypothetical protein